MESTLKFVCYIDLRLLRSLLFLKKFSHYCESFPIIYDSAHYENFAHYIELYTVICYKISIPFDSEKIVLII